jgi:hypothetical protein
LKNTRGVGGTRQKLYFVGLIEEENEQITLYSIPREFDINSRVTLVGKTSLATTLYAWSPNIDDIHEHHQGTIDKVPIISPKVDLDWILDSEASKHVTKNINEFDSYSRYPSIQRHHLNYRWLITI